MTHPNGYNPMRWNCNERGCFNIKRRPKIEHFSQYLPGRIGFGDVDAVVEVNWRFLYLEWKGDDSQHLPTGQRILFERLTNDTRFCVLVVSGDAETMEISARSHFWLGRQSPWVKASLEDVGQFISRWASWAQQAEAA